LYADWNALSAFVNSEASRIQHAFSKNMADPESEKREKYQREMVQPAADEANSELLLAWLGSTHKEAIGERYGMHLLRVLETAKEPLAPVTINLRVKNGELSMRYDKIVAAGEVPFRGEMITLSKA